MDGADLIENEASSENNSERSFVENTYRNPQESATVTLSLSSKDQLPSKNKTDYDPRLLKEIFPPEKADGSYMLGIIAIHGNEPQIMTAAVAAEVNQILEENGLPPANIVLPSIYGDRTKMILEEEFPAIKDKIFISQGLGNILKRTEFSRAGYQAHMREVAEKQPQVYEELMNFLSRPFEATSLTGEVKEFKPEGKRLEINAGANVTASQPGEQKTHFIFPVLLSEMMEATLKDPTLSPYFNHQTLERVISIAKDFEGSYATTQVPYIHTLYGNDSFNPEGKLLTPPFKRVKEPPTIEVKENKGLLIMASGNEIGRESVEDQARQLEQKGYDILFPSWMNLDFGRSALPDIIYHPNVVAVMSRMGWGTGWMSQVAEKPFIAMPHLWFDNPEIHFNLTAIKEAGTGMVWSDRADLIEEALKLQPGIHSINEKIKRELGLGDEMDGIRFAAEKIVQNELDKVSKSN